MPDWLTHVVIGLVIAEIFNVKKKSIVLLGAILPDLLPKLVLLRLLISLPSINFNFLNAFHVPFILFLFTLLIAPLFRYKYWKVVLWLNIGAISHFLADSFLRHFSNYNGIKFLYPLSLEKYSLNLVWPEQSYFILIPALILYLIIIIVKKKIRYCPKEKEIHNFNIKLN